MNFLSREATVAKPGFNRWLVPPAAISVHMCIGEVYGFSVFNVPLTQAGAGWTIPQVGWVYSIALFMLGMSAAVFGKWVERSGPRKTMAASCVCFCGGLLISAIGVKLKILWLLYLGYGVLGGIGLGLGYISPVSTLIKWFPDRPGMATGMAIMGFGGGALIGAPLGVKLMDHFPSATSIGVAEAFIAMACFVCGLHAVRRMHRPCAPAGLETGWLGAKPACQTDDDQRQCRGRCGVEDSAVLVPLGRAVHERQRRHRHSRTGIQDVLRYVRRQRGRWRRLCGPAEHLQHGRPVCLVIHFRPHRS